MPPKGAKILCDTGVSYHLISALRASTTFRYVSAFQQNWEDISDTDLLRKADENGFPVLITTDQNMVHQQRMANFEVGIVILGTNDNPTLLANITPIIKAIRSITRRGKIAFVPLTTPKPTTRKPRRPRQTGQ